MSTMTLTAPVAAPRAGRVRGGRRVGATCATTTTPRRKTGPARAAAPAVDGRDVLRLTRRGRLVLFVLALVVCAAASLAVTSSGSASGTARQVPVQYVTVLPGDTLWNIAKDVAPGVDPRDTVAQIVELNALQGSSLQAGQRLAVPAQR